MLRRNTNRGAFIFVMLAVLLALSALVGVRAANANNVPREGSRINLFPGFVGPTTYPSRTPFFVNHGWGCGLHASEAARDGDCLRPTTTFRLFVDGREVPSITDLEVGPGGIVQAKIQVFNFRRGLPAGVHVLDAQWWLDGSLALHSVVPVTFS